MKAVALALVACVGCADARDLFRPYAPNHPEVEALLARPLPPGPIDVGLVLGCPAAPDGTASPCQLCRVDTAVALYRQGVVRNLIFSGADAHSPHVEADVMADLAERRGVPRAHVFREPRALTTWQNLRFSQRIMRAQGFRTAVMISTADHLPRARRIGRYYGFDEDLTGYVACDRDLPPDLDPDGNRPAEQAVPPAPATGG